MICCRYVLVYIRMQIFVFIYIGMWTYTHFCNTSYTDCNAHCKARCNTLQHTATHCNTLQHSATHCNTLQHTATRTQSVCYALWSLFCCVYVRVWVFSCLFVCHVHVCIHNIFTCIHVYIASDACACYSAMWMCARESVHVLALMPYIYIYIYICIYIFRMCSLLHSECHSISFSI